MARKIRADQSGKVFISGFPKKATKETQPFFDVSTFVVSYLEIAYQAFEREKKKKTKNFSYF